MTKLNQLISDVSKCDLCKNELSHEPRPVVQLSSNAKILIAGQAPGLKVHESGIPFDDASGDRLRSWLGIDKATFYDKQKIAILPMGFCYPGRGKSGDLPPLKKCKEIWHQKILEEMEQIELKIIIGQYALDYYLKDQRKKNLTETVKAWENFWPEHLILPHPSPRNNIWLKKNAWFEAEVIPKLQTRIKNLITC